MPKINRVRPIPEFTDTNVTLLLVCSDTDTEYRYQYQELFDDNDR